MSFRTLKAYEKAFDQAMKCFELSKCFPAAEKFDMTSQIRRSSRSVCAQIGEGYRKRKYPKYFVSKLIDADGENTETSIWLDFSVSCGYTSENKVSEIKDLNTEVGRLLNYMIENPGKFGAI